MLPGMHTYGPEVCRCLRIDASVCIKYRQCLHARTLYFMIHPSHSLFVANHNPHFSLLFLDCSFKATFVAMDFAFTVFSIVLAAVKCLFEKLN